MALLPSASFSVDVVIPTVRANASGIVSAINLPIPPALAGLRFLIVVDGPQRDAARRDLQALEDSCASRTHGRVTLLATEPTKEGKWPAGASAARNVGISHSLADWVLFLDDDTTPDDALLYEYADALSHAASSSARVYGFAGVTHFEASPNSLWAVAARCSGLIDALSLPRQLHPPWSPTANSCCAVRRRAERGESTVRRQRQPRAVRPLQQARLLATAEDGGSGLVHAAAPRLGWCEFDERLPRNGGGEDVDICLRALRATEARHTLRS